MRDTRERCEQCRWMTSKKTYGEDCYYCCFHPPTVNSDSNGDFPVVALDEFCSKWEKE